MRPTFTDVSMGFYGETEDSELGSALGLPCQFAVTPSERQRESESKCSRANSTGSTWDDERRAVALSTESERHPIVVVRSDLDDLDEIVQADEICGVARVQTGLVGVRRSSNQQVERS
jgi:hypothetical protein